MIVIACGGRNFADREFVYNQLDALHAKTPITRLVHGGCNIWDPVTKKYVGSGADWLAHDWVRNQEGIYSNVIGASHLFEEYGKVGGRIRNIGMAYYALGLAHALQMHPSTITCVAFKGGTGTAHMCQVAQQYDFNVIRTWENSQLRFE